MLGAGAELVGLSVIDTSTPRASWWKPQTERKLVGAAGFEERRDTPWNAIYVRLLDASRSYRRQMWLRGVPDGWIRYDRFNRPQIEDEVQPKLTAFLAAAVAAQFRFRALLRGGANFPVPISGINVDPEGRVRITANGHTFAEGQEVTVTGIRGSNLRQRPPGYRQVNGLWTVVNPAPNTFSIPLLAARLTGVPAWASGGTVRSRLLADPPPTFDGAAITPIKFSRVKTGRAILVSKGRNRRR
jgi:hypothetical protein